MEDKVYKIFGVVDFEISSGKYADLSALSEWNLILKNLEWFMKNRQDYQTPVLEAYLLDSMEFDIFISGDSGIYPKVIIGDTPYITYIKRNH
jgi:hypothetical protein